MDKGINGLLQCYEHRSVNGSLVISGLLLAYTGVVLASVLFLHFMFQESWARAGAFLVLFFCLSVVLFRVVRVIVLSLKVADIASCIRRVSEEENVVFVLVPVTGGSVLFPVKDMEIRDRVKKYVKEKISEAELGGSGKYR